MSAAKKGEEEEADMKTGKKWGMRKGKEGWEDRSSPAEKHKINETRRKECISAATFQVVDLNQDYLEK